jgi:uncharacterized protein (DUF2141 family)
MKYLLFISITFLICSFKNENDGKIKINLTGIDVSKKGNLVIGVFKKENFPIENKSSYNKIIPVTDSKMEITFNNINPNDYGIAVFQDKDKNNKLSTNLIGIPNEPFGFSNNKFGTFGPPEFKDVSIKVSESATTEISIKMKYISYLPF